MTEMPEKKGKLKITVEFEVNEELMELAKESMSKMSLKLPEMMRGHTEKKETRMLSLFDLGARTEVIACRATGERTCLLKVALLDGRAADAA